jgi:dTDP-4-amino-4,6-dideoxygalactose transaminase
MTELAIFGGTRAIGCAPGDLFRWPIVTGEDEEAVLDVLRRGAMSGTDVTVEFETEFARWIGAKYALAYPSGTESVRAALWACGLGAGDEILSSSLVIWAGCSQALALGAAVHFADIAPDTLCLDPSDLEHRIGPRTRAIVVVHYCGYPADMDAIVPIARRHGLRVVEDVSHAHGALYRGRMCGTLGDVAAMSVMSAKGLAVGEGGMLVTDDRDLYERAIAFGHYERTGVAIPYFQPTREWIKNPELRRFAGVPLGTYKHRMNQMCSALGRVQLRRYPERMAEIQRAMNRFWDLLDGVPGIRAHRPPAGSGSTMGAWYYPAGLYRAEELDGLAIERFCEAVRAEGFEDCQPGRNAPLHLHPMFHEADIFRQGQPTMVAFGQRDVRQGPGSLPACEAVARTVLSVPWFKHDRPDAIAEYAEAFRKVARNVARLRETAAGA